MIKHIAITVFILCVFCGCGYKISGYGDNSSVYKLGKIRNYSQDLTVDDEIKNYIYSFFIIGDSDTELDFILSDFIISSDITDFTKEAVRSKLFISMRIIAYDKDGSIIYDSYFSASETFITGATTSEFNFNKSRALKASLDDIFNLFRYEYEGR